MPKYTVTIDVADFTMDGQVPRLAFATFSRANVDTTTGEVVTIAPVSVRLTQTPATLQLEAGVAYKVQLDGVTGLSAPFFIRHTAAATLAELRRAHQIDPATLDPAAPVPATLAQQVADLTATVATLQSVGLGGAAGGFLGGNYPNPGVNETALDNAVAGRVKTPTSAARTALLAVIDGATKPSVSDNGDGTFTISGSSVSDNGDGTFTLAA